MIGDRRFAAERDGDDLLGFVVFERGDDQLEKLAAGNCRGFGFRRAQCFRSGSLGYNPRFGGGFLG
jgi:hypothetical protein